MGVAERAAALKVRGRAMAEALMVDTLAAYEPTGRMVQDEATGREDPLFEFRGSTFAKIQAQSAQGDTRATTVNIGGVERPVIVAGLHIPVSAPVPEVGWEYECTAVGDLSDAPLIGRRWRVVDSPSKTHMTARRLDVVEVS